MPAATSRALLCLAALCLSAPAARAGPACVGTNEQNLIANQTEQAYYCALDGSQDDVQFQVTNVHSVNNDQYHLHAVVVFTVLVIFGFLLFGGLSLPWRGCPETMAQRCG